MRQNATPCYGKGQSDESAFQAGRAKLSDTNAPIYLINDTAIERSIGRWHEVKDETGVG